MHLKSCEGDCIFARKSHQNAFNFLFSSYRNWNESSTNKLYNNKSDCSHVLVLHINPLYLTPRNTTTAIHEPEPVVPRTKMSDPVQSGPGISFNQLELSDRNWAKFSENSRTAKNRDKERFKSGPLIPEPFICLRCFSIMQHVWWYLR